MRNMIQASKVKVGDTIVLYGTQYPVLHAGTVNGTTMITIRDTPFVSSNYASYAWNDKVEVAFPTCDRCKWDTAVKHTQCLYYGVWHSGHSSSHCTANACY